MDADFKKEVIDQSLEDIKTDLDEEFDRNFQRRAFFDELLWPERKFDDGYGSLMQRTGELRTSVHSRKRRGELVYSSSKPYARIHNEGGEIKVTRKMKRFFLAKYLDAANYEKPAKRGEKRPSISDKQLQGWLVREGETKDLSDKAEFWRRMALKKVGSVIKIPERRYIGHGKATDKIIRDIVAQNMDEYLKKHPIIRAIDL